MKIKWVDENFGKTVVVDVDRTFSVSLLAPDFGRFKIFLGKFFPLGGEFAAVSEGFSFDTLHF